MYVFKKAGLDVRPGPKKLLLLDSEYPSDGLSM